MAGTAVAPAGKCILLRVMPDDAPDTVLLRTRGADEIASALREHSVLLLHRPGSLQGPLKGVRPGVSCRPVRR
ncbi:hypothetical protein ABZ924_08680 [Streptomyces sp. NPDC046876]|uniref:hypothetical protein n=1 Tax=Streptomyces sp. NPDC046876 TaxID=3155616 RepID=UPI0033C98EBA